MTQKKRPLHENLNPESHPHVQALLDLEKIGFPGARDILNSLMDNTEEMTNVRQKLVGIWNAHMYPDKSIRFVMSSTYDRCPERFSLSIEAQSLLSLMERIQSKQTGTIAVKKRIFAEVLGLSKTKTERIQQYLNELEDAGFIQCISMPPKGSHSPAVYKINQRVTWVGVQHNNQDTPSLTKKGFTRTYKQVIEEIVLPDGTKTKCGSLGEYQEKPTTKKDGDAGNIAENLPEQQPGPVSVTNIHQKQYNNQDVINISLNEAVLTKEEATLFNEENLD